MLKDRIVTYPKIMYETTPVISCLVDFRAIQDVDASIHSVHRAVDQNGSSMADLPLDSSIGISSYTFTSGNTDLTTLKTTQGGTRNVMYLTDHSSTGRKFRCSARTTDSCGAGQGGTDPLSVPAQDQITVQSMTLSPTFGQIRGGETVEITGRGFIAEQTDAEETLYSCHFGSETWSGRGLSASAVECTTAEYFGESGATAVQLKGPVIQYIGCFESQDVSSSLKVINVEEQQTSLMRCQVLCAMDDANHMLYGLRGNQCLCSSDNALLSNVAASKKADDRCEATCKTRSMLLI